MGRSSQGSLRRSAPLSSDDGLGQGNPGQRSTCEGYLAVGLRSKEFMSGKIGSEDIESD